MWFGATPDVFPENIRALGLGYEIARTLADVHQRASNEVDSRLAPIEGEVLIADQLLRYHGMNLFVDSVELILRGRFDTVQYFVRPLFDIGAMLLISRRKPEYASKLLSGELEASRARREVVAQLRAEGYAVEADELDQSWKHASSAVQASSHIGMRQLQKLISVAGDEAVPIAGGRVDPVEAVDAGRLVIAAEMRLVANIVSNHSDVLSRCLQAEIDVVRRDAMAWLVADDAS